MHLRFLKTNDYFFWALIIFRASFFALTVCPLESCFFMGTLMLTPGPSKHATEGSGLGVCTRKLQVGGRAKFICSKTSFFGFDDEETAFFFLFAFVIFPDGISAFLLDRIGRIFLAVGGPGFFCPALKASLSNWSRECPC